MAKKVMVVAGEVSGDQHAARLVRDLRAVRGDVEFFGIGGDAMRREGVRTVVDAREMAVVGFFEVLMRYFFFRRVFNQMVALLAAEKPDALLLVDYPGFNLRLAAEAHARGIPVLVDGAQAIPHFPVDVPALGADFYVFSGHKVFAPTGIGVLWGKASLLAAMPPFLGGGDMIERVGFDVTTSVLTSRQVFSLDMGRHSMT